MELQQALKVIRRTGIKIYPVSHETDLFHVELPGHFFTRLITTKGLIKSAIDLAGTPNKKWYWLT